MRDNHDGMPEILDGYERAGQYFGMVALERNGVTKRFEFGVSLDGYRALRKVLQLRPFDAMPGTTRRFFFGGSYGKVADATNYQVTVRVEQARDGKLIDVQMPQDLVANLVWFWEIKDFSETSHLVEK